MRNNLTKAKKNGIKNADKACFYLKKLHKETGLSEQFLLASIVIDAVEKHATYRKYKTRLVGEWAELETV